MFFSDLGFNELFGQRLKLMLLCKPYFFENSEQIRVICLQLSFSHPWFSFVGLTQLKLLRIVTLVLSKIPFLVPQQKFTKKRQISSLCLPTQSHIWGIQSRVLQKLLIACPSSGTPAVHTFLLSTQQINGITQTKEQRLNCSVGKGTVWSFQAKINRETEKWCSL